MVFDSPKVVVDHAKPGERVVVSVCGGVNGGCISEWVGTGLSVADLVVRGTC